MVRNGSLDSLTRGLGERRRLFGYNDSGDEGMRRQAYNGLHSRHTPLNILLDAALPDP